VQKYFPTIQEDRSSDLLELLTGFLFIAVVALVLIKLTALYGLLPTGELDYSDAFLDFI
jgi:hypothetical protein